VSVPCRRGRGTGPAICAGCGCLRPSSGPRQKPRGSPPGCRLLGSVNIPARVRRMSTAFGQSGNSPCLPAVAPPQMDLGPRGGRVPKRSVTPCEGRPRAGSAAPKAVQLHHRGLRRAGKVLLQRRQKVGAVPYGAYSRQEMTGHEKATAILACTSRVKPWKPPLRRRSLGFTSCCYERVGRFGVKSSETEGSFPGISSSGQVAPAT